MRPPSLRVLDDAEYKDWNINKPPLRPSSQHPQPCKTLYPPDGELLYISPTGNDVSPVAPVGIKSQSKLGSYPIENIYPDDVVGVMHTSL